MSHLFQTIPTIGGLDTKLTGLSLITMSSTETELPLLPAPTVATSTLPCKNSFPTTPAPTSVTWPPDVSATLPSPTKLNGKKLYENPKHVFHYDKQFSEANYSNVLLHTARVSESGTFTLPALSTKFGASAL